MTQRRLRPSQGGQMREVRPSAELVAAMRAHDDRARRVHVRADGVVGSIFTSATVVYAESDVVVRFDRRDESPREQQPAEPRRWSVEAVRWMVARASGVMGQIAEWSAMPQAERDAIWHECDIAKTWCTAELARLPRWSEREVAYLRARAADSPESSTLPLDSSEIQRMWRIAKPFATPETFRVECARLVAIHDVLSVVG